MSPQQTHTFVRIGKPLLFSAGLLPLAWLFWLGFTGQLGANPVETLSHHTGDWSLRFLLLTLAVTPLRRLTGWNGLQRFRRMLGLFAFFYVCLHFGVYLVFDQFFDVQAILRDVAKRPYITVGFASFLLLIPLAITSTNGMIKRLGRNWQRLHRLVYLIGVLGVLHYLWLVKADIAEPLFYAGVLSTLLGYRLWWHYSMLANPARGRAITLGRLG
ncbi:MAG: protein-methionine-sulfoxide reductase heme-binding subunit MsrQ [Candidatus Competibacteraceae bacterium]